MGITKSELFKKRQNKMAVLAKAFDHPARVAILEYSGLQNILVQLVMRIYQPKVLEVNISVLRARQ